MLKSFEVFDKLDVDYIFELTKNCSYVKLNSDYTRKANETNLTYSNQSIVNAYARSYNTNKHEINIFAGLSHAFHFIAYALGDYELNKNIERLKQACKWAGKKAIDGFEYEDIHIGCDAVGIYSTNRMELEAKSYWCGHLLAVVAHELGHICLSHTLNYEDSNTCSRNDERQADLFAFSVIATTPFAKYNAMATLFVDILFAWMSDGNEDTATTHPHSKERVLNCLASNHTIYRAYGITKDNINDFLPNASDFIDDDDDENE